MFNVMAPGKLDCTGKAIPVYGRGANICCAPGGTSSTPEAHIECTMPEQCSNGKELATGSQATVIPQVQNQGTALSETMPRLVVNLGVPASMISGRQVGPAAVCEKVAKATRTSTDDRAACVKKKEEIK